jgi:hypothetical protein
MARVTLTITDQERQALVELARAERRDPRAQGAMILRHALERSGFLAPLKTANGRNPVRKESTTHVA